MKPRTAHELRLVLLGFACCTVLSVFPLGPSFNWWRPAWLPLFTIYCVQRFPRQFGVGWAWLIGLLMDGMEGAPMGKNALAMAILVLLTHALLRRIQLLSAWQQAGLVFSLVLGFALVNIWIESLIGQGPAGLWFLAACAASALVWPVLRLGMDALIVR